ncbi:RBCK1 [Symbiodinium sp. CCMP2592]|nr:RBCK1 [Symbiodinium sp. CCMP2592]
MQQPDAFGVLPAQLFPRPGHPGEWIQALPNQLYRTAVQPLARPEFIIGARVEYLSARFQTQMRGVITSRSPFNMLEISSEPGQWISVHSPTLRLVQQLEVQVARYPAGAAIEYLCRERRQWRRGTVTAVMPRTGNLQISLRPGYWLNPAEQQTILRPLLQPALSRSASAAGQNAVRPEMIVEGAHLRFFFAGAWKPVVVRSVLPDGNVQIGWHEGTSFYTATTPPGLLQNDPDFPPDEEELRRLNTRLSRARAQNPVEDYKIPQALDALALPGLRSMEQPQFRLGFVRAIKALICSKSPVAEQQVFVKVRSANLSALQAALDQRNERQRGPHSFVCSIKVGPVAAMRAGKLRSKHTHPSTSGGLRPTWGADGIDFAFNAPGDEFDLALCVKICKAGRASHSELLAVAEMEIPPGRHAHRLLLFPAVEGAIARGPLILFLETVMVESHIGVSCISCRTKPIRGPRFQCSICPKVNLCHDCYPLRATVHPDHDFLRIETADYLEPTRSSSVRSNLSLADSGRHLLQEALVERELASQDLIVELVRTTDDTASSSAEIDSFGLCCAADEEDENVVLIEDILSGSPAADWNIDQDRTQPWGTFMLIGDEIKQVNGKTGSESMLSELGTASRAILHITRPSRRARAVLEATAGDVVAAGDILLGDDAATALHLNSEEQVCAICTDTQRRGGALRIRPCGHGWFCRGCIQQWTAVQMSEGKSAVSCPIPECRRSVGHRQLRAVLSIADFGRFVRRSVENLCLADPSLIACPTPDCPYRAWIGEGDRSRLICEVCFMESCVRCGASPFHHGLSCEEETRRSALMMEGYQRIAPRIEECLRQAMFRSCPGCNMPIERTDACCHMTCSHCHTEFSWICGNIYNVCRTTHNCMHNSIYLHEILGDELRRRNLPATDEMGSDLFLEFRAAYLLAQIRAEVGEEMWQTLQSNRPDLLHNVIRGRGSIPWDNSAVLARLRQALPHAFP